MTFLLNFNMFSHAHTHTHSHLPQCHGSFHISLFLFSAVGCPKTNWFFPFSPNKWMWICECLCGTMCTRATKYSVEFQTENGNLCRNCIMFCLLAHTHTRREEGVNVRKPSARCARLSVNVNDFSSFRVIFISKILCCMYQEYLYMYLSFYTRSERKKS